MTKESGQSTKSLPRTELLAKRIYGEGALGAIAASEIDFPTARALSTAESNLSWQAWASEVAHSLGQDGEFLTKAFEQAPKVGMTPQGHMFHLLWLGSIAMLQHARPVLRNEGYGFKDLAFKATVIEPTSTSSSEYVNAMHRLGKRISRRYVSGVPNGGIHAFSQTFGRRDSFALSKVDQSDIDESSGVDATSLNALMEIDTSDIEPSQPPANYARVTPIFYDSFDTLLGSAQSNGIHSAMRLLIRSGRMQVMSNTGESSADGVLAPTVLNTDTRSLSDRMARIGDISSSFIRSANLSYPLNRVREPNSSVTGRVIAELNAQVLATIDTIKSLASPVIHVPDEIDSPNLIAMALGVAFWRIGYEAKAGRDGSDLHVQGLRLIDSDFAIAELLQHWSQRSQTIFEGLNVCGFALRFVGTMVERLTAGESVTVEDNAITMAEKAMKEADSRIRLLIITDGLGDGNKNVQLNMNIFGFTSSARKAHAKRWSLGKE